MADPAVPFTRAVRCLFCDTAADPLLVDTFFTNFMNELPA
jgi:hypothetical protein